MTEPTRNPVPFVPSDSVYEPPLAAGDQPGAVESPTAVTVAATDRAGAGGTAGGDVPEPTTLPAPAASGAVPVAATDSDYEGPIPFPAAECSPHRANIIAAQKKHDDLKAAGWKLWQQGDEDAALAVYDAAGEAWDDAIHISNPDDPVRSLCGYLGRNLALLDGPRPGGGEGCWTCLSKADARGVSP